ncbi:TPA: hypothetical protein N0F65_002074 [Lagenidium giganteum]|uniref:Kinesin-like protein n=1 Tax=Lagenidium giganteum TaxID=4803 RepID=A0AAV2ZC40_9STRA|nr:TPA: hypothetical protein N0F65_002074 [Lagenidium giganteum]
MAERVRSVERVRVLVRVRPENERERESKAPNVIEVDSDAHQVLVHARASSDPNQSQGQAQSQGQSQGYGEVRFTFDRVLAPSSTQLDVFDELRDSVQQVAQGFNCTVFAYGQTGTGKTHTMMGKGVETRLDDAVTASTGPPDEWGVMPRAFACLFDELAAISAHGAAAIVHCSYMQIYNNEVYDLLQENRARMKEPLAVRELIKGNDRQIYVSGVSEFRVASVADTVKLLRLGNNNRAIRATAFNERSSRSHALLQLNVEVESRGAERATIIRRAKLNLVDLAGSEKWAPDVVRGAARCKELTAINQSLSALGNVIAALANPKRSHVPYRDSRLTRLLQDSLGGNTRTVVIATVSPVATARDETLSTLQFADRAKCVAVRVKVNEVVDDAVLLAQAQREIARLKLELQQQRQGATSADATAAMTKAMTALEHENAVLRAENARLLERLEKMEKMQNQRRSKEMSLEQDEARDDDETSPEQDVPTHVPSAPVMAKLRLDLVPGHHDHSASKRQSAQAFERQQLENLEQQQEAELEHILTARRELERELDRINLNSARGESADSVNVASTDDDADACPMCGRIIDHHTDEELDECIEREAEQLALSNNAPGKPKEVATTSEAPAKPVVHQERSSDNNRAFQRVNQGPSGTASRPPPQALQRALTSGGNSNSNPYAQDLERRFISNEMPTKATSFRSRRTLREPERTELKSSDGHSHGRAPPKQREVDAAMSALGAVVRQGPKSLKLLKQLQTSSPYNLKSRRHSLPDKPRGNGRVEHEATAGGSSGAKLESNPNAIVNTVHDIGLRLMIYKFRYDCWYPCTIVGFDSKRRLHCCQYEYGDKQWQDLGERKVQVLGRGDNDT